MKPLKLISVQKDSEDKIPPSIIATTMSGKYFCTIWADERITFNPEFEYSPDELEQITGLQKHFFTIYNSIVEKDKLIAHLQEENKELLKEIIYDLNPVIDRQ